MSDKNYIQSAIEAGKEIGAGKVIKETDSRTHIVLPPNCMISSFENKKNTPDRKTGLRTFVSAKSFCSYVNKHKSDDQTIIIADERKNTVRTVLNDHGLEPEWGDFQADLILEKSRQWKTWANKDDKLMGQEEFAQFVEDNRSDFMCGIIKDANGKDVENISGVALNQLILDLNVSVDEKLESKINPQTGERSYSYSNEQNGKGGFKTPKTFTLAIPIFKNGDLLQVIVNLRTRMENQTARFGFRIDQIDERIEKAFGMVCDRITEGVADDDSNKSYEGTGIEVYRGEI